MNVVFIPNIKLDDRSNNYHYSIYSWQKWAEQYDDVTVIEWKDAVMDPSVFKITLQRYWVHDILKHNKIEYDQVLLVDADTIIHPKCPNFFKETNNKFGVTINNGCYEWVTRSINAWGHSLFPNEPRIKTWKYFNGGFQITNKTHIDFYKKVQEYYTTNIEEINRLNEVIKAGTDQTIINYLTQIHNIPTTYMSESYNLQDLYRKSLIYMPKYHPENSIFAADQLLFLQAGWIYHFNAIPPCDTRDANYWIERTFKHLYQ